jgi:hypothetical protein
LGARLQEWSTAASKRCSWTRGKADVLYVADAFAVMARLNALLAESH